jgi:hypothetical protein
MKKMRMARLPWLLRMQANLLFDCSTGSYVVSFVYIINSMAFFESIAVESMNGRSFRECLSITEGVWAGTP